MNGEFQITRKICALSILCCVVVFYFVTKNETSTKARPNFSLSSPTVATSLQTNVTTTVIISPISQTSNPWSASSSRPPFELVAQEFESFVNWRRDCNYKPDLCEIGKFTILGTQFSDEFATMMHEFAKNNIYARPGDGQRKIIVERITEDASTMTAVVHGCVYDTAVLYMDGGIFDDKVASSLSSWTMQWHNDRWFWRDYQIHKKVYNQNLCE